MFVSNHTESRVHLPPRECRGRECCPTYYSSFYVGGQDLSHKTLGTETVDSHQEPGVGLEEDANKRHEPTVNEMEGYGSKMKTMNEQ
jgi:hypothetical protein